MKKHLPILGFDVGGTKIVVSLGTEDGHILGSERIDNHDKTPDEILPKMVAAGKELMKSAGIKPKELRAAGIGAPGPMDIPNGLILCPPNMKTWKKVAIRDYIAEQFGVETFFDNDANANALAEWFFGAGKGAKNLIYLTQSTGIGGGVIVNGHMVYGKSFLAGELGHITLDINGPKCNCGMTGCYEAFCGGRAIAQRLQKELKSNPEHPIVKNAGGKIENIKVEALVKAVRDGNDYAKKFWDEVCLRNAQALGIFLNALNPEIIVLGTIAWAAEDIFMEPVKKHLKDYSWPETLAACKIVTSGLRNRIGEYSGICVALYNLYEKGEYRPSWK